MYYPDLSPYEYLLRAGRGGGGKNIGWLEKGKEFPTGEVPQEFLSKLRDLSNNLVNRCRGWHDCGFCNSSLNRRGNGEIHVYIQDGQLLIAPALVLHYIEEHNYLPPQIFIDAVMNPGQRKKVSGDPWRALDPYRTGKLDVLIEKKIEEQVAEEMRQLLREKAKGKQKFVNEYFNDWVEPEESS